MSREQTQNIIYFNVNVSLRQQRKSPFIAKTVEHWYFTQMFKMSAVCRNTSTETLTPLLDSVVDDALVLALPLLSDALPRNSSRVRIFSVDAYLEHAPYTIVYRI